MPPMRVVAESAEELVAVFLRLQQERAETFALFGEGFEAYLRSEATERLALYHRLVGEVTETFAALARQARDVEEAFRLVHHRDDLADTVQRVQALERVHLRDTVRLQVARQLAADPAAARPAAVDRRGGDANGADNDDEEEEEMDEQSLRESVRASEAAITEILRDLRHEMAD